jgi:uncharacterized protein YyaL (SSP411 family)
LGALTGRDDLTTTGKQALEAIQAVLEREPAACGQSLIALDFLLGKVAEFVVIAGDDPAEMRAVLEAIAKPFSPHTVVAPATPDQAAALAQKLPLLAHRPVRDRRTTIYMCEGSSCREPVVGVAGVEAIASVG